MAQRADIRERILCCLVLQECTHFCVYVYDDAFDSFIIHRMHSYLAIHHIFHSGMGAFSMLLHGMYQMVIALKQHCGCVE